MDNNLLPTLILNISRLTNRQSTEANVVANVAAELAQHLPKARISLWLSARPDGQNPVHASRGDTLPGEARLLFSRPLGVRGTEYGKLQVELVGIHAGMPAGTLICSLETIALQLALYAETLRLERETNRLRVSLATGKAVARASGVLSRKLGIPVTRAQAWLHEEAARKGRSLLWLADMLIFGERLLGDQHERQAPRPGLPLRPPVARPSASEEYAA
jgi:hypothetical protein